jgi:hypothetical protein
MWSIAGSAGLIAIRDSVSEVPYVPPGDGVFTYSGGLYAAQMVRIEIPQGGLKEAVLRLDLATPVTGRVEIPRGQKVACHLLVLPLNANLPAPPAWPAPRVPVARDGGFVLGAGPRGPQALIAVADGYALSVVTADNTSGPVHGASIPLVRGVTVQLTTDHRGLQTPFVQVETEASVPLYASSLAEPRTLRLAAGKYRIRFMDCKSEWREKALLVEGRDMKIAVP